MPKHRAFLRPWGAFLVAVAAGGCVSQDGPALTPRPAPVVATPGGAYVPVDIPRGQLPPPGSCRVWIPGVPPGRQDPPGDCDDLLDRVPAGAVLVRG